MPKPRIERPRKVRMIEEQQAMPAQVCLFKCCFFKTLNLK